MKIHTSCPVPRTFPCFVLTLWVLSFRVILRSNFTILLAFRVILRFNLTVLLAFHVILKSNLKTFNLIGRQSLSPPLMAVRLQLVKELFCCLLIIIPLSNACWLVFTDPPPPPPQKCLMLVDGLRILFTHFYMPADWFGDLAWSVEWHSKVEQWHGVK